MSTQHAGAHQNTPTWTEPPWSGWIETTGDALLILEAARRGLIPRVTRRLVDSERKMITSGSVFVFDEDESGIKRWTDGFFWSPSRILGNFLLYRETDKRGAGSRSGKEGEVSELDNSKGDGSLSRPKSDPGHPGVDKQRERTLVGSLTNSYKFKPDGLMKKTFSLTIAGVAQHLISYYKIEDVESGRLRPPSSLPELASLEISPEYLDKTHFRNPPKVEMGTDGVLRYRGEADDIDTSASLLTGPPLTGLPLLTGGREVPENAKRIKRFEPYGQSSVPTPKRQRKTPGAKPSSDPSDGSQPQQPQSQQDVAATPIASPASPQVPSQGFTGPNPPSATSPPAPAITTPPAPYPSFGVAPYYGYAQPPPPHLPMYPPQPGYPSPGQSMPPPPTHPGQYVYAGYPPPAPVLHPPTAAGTSPPSGPTPTNLPVTSSDPSQPQPSGITTSPPQSQPPVNPQMQSQTGYYHPHVHAPPHPYYPPPPHAQPAPGAPPPMYAGYPPPPPHTGPPPPPPPAVWAPHHPHPYGAYPPPPPHPQQAPPPPLPPQSYPYPSAYPAPAPPPSQQAPSPHQQQQSPVPPGQYQHPYHHTQQYTATAQVGSSSANALKTNGTPVAGRDVEGEDGGASE